jgi:hypothetical protein
MATLTVTLIRMLIHTVRIHTAAMESVLASTARAGTSVVTDIMAEDLTGLTVMQRVDPEGTAVNRVTTVN